MKIYLTNAFSLSMLTKDVKLIVKEMDLKDVKNFLQTHGFTSAIGHSTTAEVLSNLLGLPVETNRIQVQLQSSSDEAIVVFQLQTRLSEGQVLSKEELEKLNFKFYKVMLD